MGSGSLHLDQTRVDACLQIAELCLAAEELGRRARRMAAAAEHSGRTSSYLNRRATVKTRQGYTLEALRAVQEFLTEYGNRPRTVLDTGARHRVDAIVDDVAAQSQQHA